MADLKRTPLYDAQVKAGGKIVEYSGWEMAVQYVGLVEEHNAVRNAAGLFDVSHMGEIVVKGKEATEYVDNLVNNHAAVMHDYQVVYAQMCYPDGGIVDDLLVYKRTSTDYYLVVNASNVDRDFAWMLEQKGNYDVEIINVSDETAEVAFQGPLAQEILQTITNYDLAKITFFTFADDVEIAGYKCLVSRTGYTGEDGFEIYTTDSKGIVAIWDAILAAGKDKGVLPAGLGCRDTLRFEACLPLYGHEIDKHISPLEAGLGMFTKLDKPNGFIGSDVLIKQKADGLKKKIVGFELIGKGIPRQGYPVHKDGVEIGYVTTGYASPTLGKTIGLALIQSEFGEMDAEFDVMIRNKPVAAKVISKRFLAKRYKK